MSFLARRDMARPGWAWLGAAGHGRARLGKARERRVDGLRRGSTPRHPRRARLGVAGLGAARQGAAGRGAAGQGREGERHTPRFESRTPTRGTASPADHHARPQPDTTSGAEGSEGEIELPWFRIDDSFYDHPKVFDAPDCAVALWVRAGTWSARNLTDGFVPARLPVRLCDDHDTAVRELLRRGLWSRTRDGFQFHDWDQYQPSAGEVRNLRSKRADAGRRGGLAKAAKQTASKRLASARPVAKQNAAPARPGPSSGTGGGVAHGGRARARDDPPPKNCPKHPNGTEDPCGPCGDARRRRTDWEAAQLAADQAKRSADAHQRADVRAAEIAACTTCDHRGYLPSGAACHHDPTRGSTGAAAARAALGPPRRRTPAPGDAMARLREATDSPTDTTDDQEEP